MEPSEVNLPVIVGDDKEIAKMYDQRFDASLVRPFVGDLKMLFAHGNAAEVYTDYFLPNAVLFQGKHVKDEDDHDYHFPPDLIDVLQPHGALAVIARMKVNIDDSKRISGRICLIRIRFSRNKLRISWKLRPVAMLM